MDKQSIRVVLLIAIFAVGMFLFNTWQAEHANGNGEVTADVASDAAAGTVSGSDLPQVVRSSDLGGTGMVPAGHQDVQFKELLEVVTDVYKLRIDPEGGDIVYLDLIKYPASLQTPDQGFVLLEDTKDSQYIIQTGLLSALGPDSAERGRVTYKVAAPLAVMDDDESILNVDLSFTTDTGVKIVKRYIFERGSYVIRVHYLIENHSSGVYEANVFGRIKRSAPSKDGGGFGGMKSYTGGAINTPSVKFKKLPFADMREKPFKEEVLGGWVAMVERYFVSALIPSVDEKNYYQTEVFPDGVYGVRFVGSTERILPGEQKILETKIYSGPEVTQNLKEVAPGLELTIDYGFLWFLCQPIFWLLKTMDDVFKNWGLAIIFTTIIIKGLFYKLSATSYRSMGNMRKLQPKIDALKERYGDDKQQFSQAMMELYKKEKINPLGGCLPILVQIPVFIALYYVLLESVDLRQAPFMLWIHDLSARDPYYVLPVIMGITMFVQQRLNPTPPDPLQAKVMMLMPVFFTFLFLQFPSGLVLYWTVNNLLSILQQWMIMRGIERHKK